MVHPTGAKIEVGYVKIDDFRPISRYISETVQARDIYLQWKSNRRLYVTVTNNLE